MNNAEPVILNIECSPEIAEKLDALIESANKPQTSHSAETIETLEKDLLKQVNEIAGLILQKQIQSAIDSEQCKEIENQILQSIPFKMINKGKVPVTLRTSTGFDITVWVSYFIRKKKIKKNRHSGIYPGLCALGIYERCTPTLAAEVALYAGMLGSLEEAKQVLAERGIELNVKVVRKIAYQFAERARMAQQVNTMDFESGVAGRKVVISADGGRTRLREKKRGKKTAKGRNRFRGEWREPKLFIIYVVNEEGKMERSFLPIIDALIRGPDEMFELLYTYLRQINLTEADAILFIADGATWIWNRIPDLVKRLGLTHDQVHELLDFYHAVEHLGKVASLKKSWTTKQRKTWITKQRKLLKEGNIDEVINNIRAICLGPSSKAIKTQLNYFIKNTSRMAYKRLRDIKMPIGSGSVESAIRRVVNLRLKGPCIFWLKESAEAILLIRSYWKAGRWNMLKNMANTFVPDAFV
jgi:hypothetical protein